MKRIGRWMRASVGLDPQPGAAVQAAGKPVADDTVAKDSVVNDTGTGARTLSAG
jgi:hypothetical protein